ncbi:MAG: DUF2829 domain-containing protein [Bryobacteraceae bacterium]
MQKYLGVKLIEAKPMTRGDYNTYRGWTIPADENPFDEGFLVVYPDGYESWSPKQQFEEAYREIDEGSMTFGLAIEAMRKGLKVSRKGWNGKGMFIFLREGRRITGVNPDSPMGGDFTSLPHFCMRSAQGDCVVGWLASQTDMLAEDWCIVE